MSWLRRIAKRRTGKRNSPYIGNIILTKINEIRGDRGLSMLEVDGTLELIALRHSQNMKKAREIFHRDIPDVCCENCYQGPMNKCVSSWMRSKGHRENLLRPSIRRGAVGVTGDYATFVAM